MFSNRPSPLPDNKLVIVKNPPLTDELVKQLLQVHLKGFLYGYQNATETQLDIPAGKNKKQWYTELLNIDLEEIRQGKMSLVLAYSNDHIVGYATYKPTKSRYPVGYALALLDENKKATAFKNDVHVSLLASRPTYHFDRPTKTMTNDLQHHGIGRELLKVVEGSVHDANFLTLDSRHINRGANAFYKKYGFNIVPGASFEGHALTIYRSYEKPMENKDALSVTHLKTRP